MLRVLTLKGLNFYRTGVERFCSEDPIATLVCEMVMDKQSKELMQSAHPGLCELSLISLLGSDIPLLDEEGTFPSI